MTTLTEELKQDATLDRFIKIKPDIDYLVKDFTGFRRLMIDHLSVLAPNWQEESPADLGNVLVDLLAYAADYASYYQDAVASEAYLGTARLRHSVKRHARLLDYDMHEGCNARVWVHVHLNEDESLTKEDTNLPRGTRLFTQMPGLAPALSKDDETAWHDMLTSQAQVFETLHDCQLYAAHNDLLVYPAKSTEKKLSSDLNSDEKLLRKGSTTAIVKKADDALLQLTIGDVLIFEEIREPTTGLESRKDPKRRHAVRLTKAIAQKDSDGSYMIIGWAEDDALPFDFFVGRYDSHTSAPFTVAHGNVVLADHGRWIKGEKLPPVPAHGRYRPALLVPGLTYQVAYYHQLARYQAATASVSQDSTWTLPVLRVYQTLALPTQAILLLLSRVQVAPNQDGRPPSSQEWRLKHDLLNSGPFDNDYIVEMEDDRRAYLRFGFDGMGKQPASSNSFSAEYRVGNGVVGNIGADTLGHLVVSAKLVDKIQLVRNPLPAQGGSEPEQLDEARLYAPQAFQAESERCVTEEDYAAQAERFPDVAHAIARIRWIGLWQTVLIFVQHRESGSVDASFRNKMTAYFEKYRYVGHEIEICSPKFVPLEIVLQIHPKPGTQWGTLLQALKDSFSNQILNNGEAGFFYRDNFTFGQPVYQSLVVATAVKVPGVAWVKVLKFGRLGSTEPVTVIQLDALEIAEIRNEAGHGTIDFKLEQ